MSKEITGDVVGHGMAGVFIERNVTVAALGWQNETFVVDVIKVPGWNLRYEVRAGLYTTDEQIQQAINLYAYGMNEGRVMGINQRSHEILKCLGIDPAKVT